MEVTQDRPSNRNRSAFYRDDKRVSNPVKPDQPLVQNNFGFVAQRDKIRNRPSHKNRRDRHDCSKPQSSFGLNRGFGPPIQRISAEPRTHDGPNRSASHANQQIRTARRAKNSACLAHFIPRSDSSPGRELSGSK